MHFSRRFAEKKSCKPSTFKLGMAKYLIIILKSQICEHFSEEIIVLSLNWLRDK